jgi:hypothetical protein
VEEERAKEVRNERNNAHTLNFFLEYVLEDISLTKKRDLNGRYNANKATTHGIIRKLATIHYNQDIQEPLPN